MPLSIDEYADSLDQRDLIWPQVPAPTPVKAKPSIDPLPEVRAVLWDIYGTLLRIPDPGFTLFPQQDIRLQVALDKTIHEFNMWNSMYRQPGPPWQSMIKQYRDYSSRLEQVACKYAHDVTDINLVSVWRAIIDRLHDKEYSYEIATYGDDDQLAEKVALFFHRCLQAMEARPGVASMLNLLHSQGIRMGLFSDGQSFSRAEIRNALRRQAEIPEMEQLFPVGQSLISYQMGVRKPSPTLYRQIAGQFLSRGIEPEQILHVSTRVETDLAEARAVGMKTALLAEEKSGLEASANLLKDPQTRPDRLLTRITQITSVVGFD